MGHGGYIGQPSLNLFQAVFRHWAVQTGTLILE
jgi:hypothetical protein